MRRRGDAAAAGDAAADARGGDAGAGTADAFALRLRYHDDATHRRYAPEGETAVALFEAMETARCEAVGARAMPGTAGNIDARIAEDARRMGYGEITDPAQAPLAQAAGYLVRHLATGRALPKGARERHGALARASSRRMPAGRSPGSRGCSTTSRPSPGSRGR